MSELEDRVRGHLGDADLALLKQTATEVAGAAVKQVAVSSVAVTQTSVGSVAATAPSTFGATDIHLSFAPGDTIVVTGFTDPANNGTFTVDSVDTDILVVTAATLETEAANGTVKKNGSFDATGIDDDIEVGDVIIASGFSNGANNGSFTVTAKATDTVVVNSVALVTEVAGGDVTKNGSFDATGIGAGFVVGDLIFCSGFSEGANNGTFTLTRVQANSISVDSTALVTEVAGDGIVEKPSDPAALQRVKGVLGDVNLAAVAALQTL